MRPIEIYRQLVRDIPRGLELTRKHVGANVEAAPARCSGSLARAHTRVKDLHGTGVRYLV